jgi:periplasmic copper chaperone A
LLKRVDLMKSVARVIAVAVLPLVLVACGDASTPATSPETTAKNERDVPPVAASFGVTGVSMRLNANATAPSAAYFTLGGGSEGATLTGITSADAGRVELHESRMDGGMMTMAAVPSIVVPANGTVEARPGGLHAMLFDVTPAARAAGKVRLTFTFADGQTVAADAVAAPADADATADEHAGH